jgi:hypothetical protein
MYYFAWYLPHREFLTYVLSNQTSGRFPHYAEFYNRTKSVVEYYFCNNHLALFTGVFCLSFLAGIIFTFRSASRRFRFLFIALTCWLLVELHKLTMTYLPSRYLVSLFFCMGMIIVVALREMLVLSGTYKTTYAARIIVVLVVLLLGIQHLYDYASSWKRRTFSISAMDDYLSHYDFAERPVLGAWAPSACWKNTAITLPVWKDYFNDTAVFKQFTPRVIIAENDEGDSEKAFESRHISLREHADSARTFLVNRWTVTIYWIRQ